MAIPGSKTFPENRGELAVTATMCKLRHLLHPRAASILKSFNASLEQFPMERLDFLAFD